MAELEEGRPLLSIEGAARLLSEPEANADGTTKDDSPKRWSALDLEPAEQPRWLADSRLPRAATCLLLGDEGIGKSLLWVLLVARITTGTSFPEFGIPPRSPGRAVLVLTEDDWSTVVRPRLEIAKADLSRIEVICTERDGGGSPIFPRDIKLLDAEPTPDIVVVDCWLDTVPSNLRVSDAQHARQALHPWKEVATRTDATVLLLGHTNRVQSPNARDRYGATYALRQKARMTLFALQDQDGHLVLGPEKANGAPIKPASKFSITGVPFFQPNPENDGTVPLLTHLDESDKTSREHLEDSFADRRKGADKPDPKLWLALLLVDGPRWAEEIEDAAQKAKITKYGLKAAKKDLKVRSQQVGSPKRWFWFLPQHDGQTPEEAEGESGVESQVDSLYCSEIDRSTSDQFSACFDSAPDDSSTSESTVDSEVESSAAPESGDALTCSDVRGSMSENNHRDRSLTLLHAGGDIHLIAPGLYGPMNSAPEDTEDGEETEDSEDFAERCAVGDLHLQASPDSGTGTGQANLQNPPDPQLSGPSEPDTVDPEVSNCPDCGSPLGPTTGKCHKCILKGARATVRSSASQDEAHQVVEGGGWAITEPQIDHRHARPRERNRENVRNTRR